MLLKILLAFLVGGFFCALAQILIDKTSLTPARILVAYVVTGVFLGAIGLYEPLFDLCGCGASLPLIGFGGSLARGVREAIDEEGVWGVLNGPVASMSAGVGVAVITGFLASLFVKGKSKRLD